MERPWDLLRTDCQLCCSGPSCALRFASTTVLEGAGFVSWGCVTTNIVVERNTISYSSEDRSLKHVSGAKITAVGRAVILLGALGKNLFLACPASGGHRLASWLLPPPKPATATPTSAFVPTSPSLTLTPASLFHFEGPS